MWNSIPREAYLAPSLAACTRCSLEWKPYKQPSPTIAPPPQQLPLRDMMPLIMEVLFLTSMAKLVPKNCLTGSHQSSISFDILFYTVSNQMLPGRHGTGPEGNVASFPRHTSSATDSFMNAQQAHVCEAELLLLLLLQLCNLVPLLPFE